MALSYIILDEAQVEFEAIVYYLHEVLKSPQAALNSIDEFEHQIELVCENPDLYDLSRFKWLARRGYHMMPVNNYGALYKLRDGVISVEHVFHQSQDYARLGL
ncbi:MAG: type II toxin-antitoxin system RelE/ParE family toxin [Eggerthellaceae bacterium]|nr:type II toxin-antitoxin system RelE/ParE family toxin [Eggerthellaceae bacterium]